LDAHEKNRINKFRNFKGFIMNFCQYCDSQIPEKTKGYKKRKFCNKSCSRKYYIKNNKNLVSEATRKGHETRKKIDPESYKRSWKMTDKRKSLYATFNETGHYKKIGKLGARAVLRNQNIFGGRDHVYQKMIENGKWFDYKVFDYDDVKKYTQTIRRLTLKYYGSAGNGFHWDHIVPIYIGYKLKISPELMCSSENIRKLTKEKNLSKGNKMIKESYELLKKWNIK